MPPLKLNFGENISGKFIIYLMRRNLKRLNMSRKIPHSETLEYNE